MSKPITRYYQKCDFCHKETEVSADGMESITLPGYYLNSDGCKTKRWVTADICQECKDKLREYLAKAVDIKEIEWVGESIHWLDDEGENNGD